MSEPTLRKALETLRDYGYQPMYNGRPSCPFCHNFVDDEETHHPRCILRAALARADDGLVAERGRLRTALDELLDDYLSTNGPDGYPQPMPRAWRVVRDWLARAALQEVTE